ncbi:hypothetical protein [Desulfuribacillus stibiiarsenatis]|nr:hypothetical protein [Desulfuribacillus stibiiarsenatis]
MTERTHNQAVGEVSPSIGWGSWIVLHVIAIPVVVFLGSLLTRF